MSGAQANQPVRRGRPNEFCRDEGANRGDLEPGRGAVRVPTQLDKADGGIAGRRAGLPGRPAGDERGVAVGEGTAGSATDGRHVQRLSLLWRRSLHAQRSERCFGGRYRGDS